MQAQRMVMKQGIYFNGQLFASWQLAELVDQIVVVDDLGVTGTEEILIRNESGDIICSAEKVGRNPHKHMIAGRFERELRRQGIKHI